MKLEISLTPEVLFHIGSFPVTNSFFWSIILSLFLISVAILINKKKKQVPGRLQCLVELFIDGSYNFVKSVVGDDKKAKKVYPLVIVMFLFILSANLATFIPGQPAITIRGSEGMTPLFRPIMADYGIVFMMTIITVITTQIVALVTHGPFRYAGKFINISGIILFFKGVIKGKFKFGILAQGFLDFFLGVMEMISEVSKIISLSFRLFGNIFAGEVLISVMLFLAPFIVPLPFHFLELLSAVVQAFVFSILTLIFITMASEIELEDDTIEKITV